MDVTKETFKASDDSTQHLILFDSIMSISNKLDTFNSNCGLRHKLIDEDIKKSGRINKGISALTGLVGGFTAFATSKFMGIF